MILPWMTLATVSVAVYSRLPRGSLLDILSAGYIWTAWAKGLSEHRIIFGHALCLPRWCPTSVDETARNPLENLMFSARCPPTHLGNRRSPAKVRRHT